VLPLERELAEFDSGTAYELIWWLIHLLGDRVTLPQDGQFWDDNMPESFRVGIDHDEDGNAVLVAERLDWQ
jgi:hypothetical protein